MGGIEGINVLKDMPTGRKSGDWMMLDALSRGDRRERENQLRFPDIHAYVFVPDPSSSTVADAASRFRKLVGNRSLGFYTAGENWPFETIRPRDMICFYNDKEQLEWRGDILENVIFEWLRREKLMMVFDSKDCYEIMEAR